MRSATAFLPSSMTTFMNLASSTLPNLGSGRISRLGTSRRRGMLLPCVSSVEPCQVTRPWPPNGTAPYVPRTVPTRGWRGCTVLAALARDRGVLLGYCDETDQAFFGRLAPYFERACLRSLTP